MGSRRSMQPVPTICEERKSLASGCVQALSLSAPVLMDELDNAVWNAYESVPNAGIRIAEFYNLLSFRE